MYSHSRLTNQNFIPNLQPQHQQRPQQQQPQQQVQYHSSPQQHQHHPIFQSQSHNLQSPPPLRLYTHPVTIPTQISIQTIPRPTVLEVHNLKNHQEFQNFLESFADKDNYFCQICQNILWQPTMCGKCNKICKIKKTF